MPFCKFTIFFQIAKKLQYDNIFFTFPLLIANNNNTFVS